MTKVFLIICCLLAAIAPYFAAKQSTKPGSDAANFPGFPSRFEDLELKNIGLTEREKIFEEDFPGKIGRFSDGRREIIIRWIHETTRKLHPAEDCFKGVGFSTSPLPVKIDEAGKKWSCFSARKGEDNLRVCELIYETSGNREWTDVSSWYWSTINESGGSWWAITTAERELP